MRLTVSGHAFEILPLDGVLAVAKNLGFKGVDISGFHARGRCSIEPEDILSNPQGQADMVRSLLDKYELDAVDFFPQFGVSPDQHSLNDPDSSIRQRNMELVKACAYFCQLLGIPGMTILPGVDHPQRSLAENLEISGQEMNKAADICGEYGVKLRFEPHMGSVTYTPELAIELIDHYAPEAKVTADYSHFVLQYIPEERIHQLLPYSDHVHIRPARPGKLQVRYEENTINWVEVVNRLKAQGYDSTLSVEYVCNPWYDLNRLDTLYETAITKEAIEPFIGQL
ncbi:MAG: sugar phosphate isomerase/epimerase [Anaerolineae bacterium]|nr:sugar phosphate isomerase/epimerase [Anaerolineae bacterium]